VVVVQPSTYGINNDFICKQVQALGHNGRGVTITDLAMSDEELEKLNDAGYRASRFNVAASGSTPLPEVSLLWDVPEVSQGYQFINLWTSAYPALFHLGKTIFPLAGGILWSHFHQQATFLVVSILAGLAVWVSKKLVIPQSDKL
jgi:hypothetical protein